MDLPLTFAGRGASAAFSPGDLSGLKLWLKADAIPSLSDGDPVTTWPDSSGQGNDATQSTGSQKPTWQTNEINGLAVVRFDGVDDVLSAGDIASLDGASAFTLFVVGKRRAANAFVNVGKRLDGDNATLLNVYSDGNVYLNVSNTALTYGGFAENTTNVRLFAMRYDGSQSGNSNRLRGWMNASEQSLSYSGTIPATTANLGNFLVGQDGGGSIYTDGDIAEVILYDTALSDSDRQSVESYLNTRYAIY